MNTPNSLRKHIRREKARIRKEVLDPKEQREQILKLREKINKTASIKKEVKPASVEAVPTKEEK